MLVRRRLRHPSTVIRDGDGILPPPFPSSESRLTGLLPLRRGHPFGLTAPHGSRGFLVLAARGGAVVLVGLAAYVGVQVWLRTEWRQKRSIRRRLCTVEDTGLGPGSTRPGDGASLWLERPERLAFLRACVEGTPSGPLVVTGPEGSGKSTLLRQAVASRPLTWYFDLREVPVTSGDQLLERFVSRAGYLPPPDELLGQVVFNRGASDAAKRKADTDKALRFVTSVLRDVQRQQMEEAAANSPFSRSRDESGGQGQNKGQSSAIVSHAFASPTGGLTGREGSRGASAGRVAELLRRVRGHDGDGSASHTDTTTDEERMHRLSQGGLGWMGKLAVRSVQRFAAVAPPWAKAVTEALQSGVLATFAVELEASDAFRSVPSHLPPLVCLDELSTINDPEDPDLHALLDWAQYLTDQRLAHVVLGCSADFAEHLDKHRSFRHRRHRIHVDFPRSVSVREFLEGPVNDELRRRARAASAAMAVAEDDSLSIDDTKEEGSCPIPEAFSGLDDADVDWLTSLPPEELPSAARLRPLTEEEVDLVVTNVGGHMKDLDAVVRQLLEGHSLASVLQRAVADCVDSVESYIELSLLQGNPLPHSDSAHGGASSRGRGHSHGTEKKEKDRAAAGDEAEEVAWRFLRLWRLMEELSKRKYISRRELTTGVFAGRGWELDELTANGLIMCANLRSTRKVRPPSHAHQSASPDVSASQPPLDLPVDADMTPPQQQQHQQHQTATIDASQIMSFASATRYVSAASPRLRAAFGVITGNPALVKQATRVRAFLRAGELRAEVAEVKESLAAVGTERSYYAQRLENLSNGAEGTHSEAPPGQSKWNVAERVASLRERLLRLEHEGIELHEGIETLQAELAEAEQVATGPSRMTAGLEEAEERA